MMPNWFRNAVRLKTLCPYCFRRFRMVRAPFRCMNVSCSVKQPEDPVLAQNWPKVAPREKGVLIDAGGRARRKPCPDCRLDTTVRVCPECHIRLPRDFDRSNNAIIAIVGAKAAGKTHFIATAIREMRNQVASDMKFSLEAMDDQTMTRYQEQYERPLYTDRVQLTVTDSGLSNQDGRLPLLFSLKLRGKDLLGRPRISKSITLAFFDTAGEDLRRRETMTSIARYIAEARGLVMLLDPTQMDYVRTQFTPPLPAPAAGAESQSNLLTRVSDLIRDLRGLRETAVIDIPAAIVLSKFDQLDAIVPSTMSVLTPTRHDRGYDAVAAKSVIDEVESLLGRWRCDDVLEQVRTNFARHAFFGISATGCNVDKGTGRYPKVSPRRVEDPLLWVLHQIGFLRGRKN